MESPRSSVGAPSSPDVADTSPFPVVDVGGLSGSIDQAGLEVAAGERRFALRVAAVGRAGSPGIGIRRSPPTRRGDRVRTVLGDEIVEWVEARERGIEHGLDLLARPPGAGSLVVEVEVEGVRPILRDGHVALLSATSEIVAHYDELLVRDADGAVLPSRFEVEGSRVRIHVQDGGARYPVVVDPLLYADVVKLFAVDRASGDSFGDSVAVAGDGLRMVVGATWEDDATGTSTSGNGAAYVLVRSATSMNFVHEAKLLAPDKANDDHFGNAAAIAADGSRVVIGAYTEDDATGSTTTNNGAAYVFVRSGSVWSFEQKLLAPDKLSDDRFGAALAMDATGTRIAVGSPWDDETSAPATSLSGSVYVFVRSGTTWSLEQKLVRAGRANTDLFGTSVAFDAAGDALVVGVPGYDDPGPPAITSCGAAIVYVRSGATWSESELVLAPDRQSLESFGESVDLTPTGDHLAVGASRESEGSGVGTTSNGAGYVFTRGVSYTQAAKLQASDRQSDDELGGTVSISDDGGVVVLGAELEDGSNVLATANRGAAYVFLRFGTVYAESQKLSAPDPVEPGYFGRALGLSGSGHWLAVGAGADDTRGAPAVSGTGAVYAYLLDGGATYCTSGPDCASGSCVDGVCCDTACGGGSPNDCLSCRRSDTSGLEGVCGVYTALAANQHVCRSASGPCDVEERCVGGVPSCPPDALASLGQICRAAGGACDYDERCTGTDKQCPPDVLVPADEVCRASAGVCDVDERCDGSTPACPADAFADGGTSCRPSSGVCDVAESCTGASVDCPLDARADGTVECRPSAGACDVPEFCDGFGATCPGDTLLPNGLLCRSPAGACDLPESCTGTSAACPADAVESPGVACRGAAGPCDVPESCDGSSPTCPADARRPSGTECRPAAGGCDLAERCDGSSSACPADSFADVGVVCRAQIGACDVAETCTGAGPDCPSDARMPAGFACRVVAGACDVAELCDGVDPRCPTDVLATANLLCRPSAGACDEEERCDGNSAACPQDAFLPTGTACRASLGPCDPGESCTGAAAACPGDALAPVGTSCRAAAGPCDLEERCDGVAVACPPDAFAPSSSLCRAVAGSCDVEERCDGTTAGCPADALVPRGSVCRQAAGPCETDATCDGVDPACAENPKLPAGTECRGSAGTCDVEERCDGTSGACPVDVRLPATQVCRPRAGGQPCDAEERCDGAEVDCPPDALEPPGVLCRSAVGSCDLPEYCSGVAGTCPTNGFVADALPCDDGLACTVTSACVAGVCSATLRLDCSDSDACTSDLCVEPAGCTHTVIPACVLDAGPDSGPGMDSAVGDGGGEQPVAAGCSCRVATPTQPPLALLAIGLLLLPRRWRRSRSPASAD